MRKLDETTWVAGQIRPEDVPEIAARGIRTIVNNRPNDEEPGQPRAGEIEAAARAAGLGYRWIPVAHGLRPEQIEDMAEALEAGPALIFCRSGTRSAYLWALARSRRGTGGDTLLRQAADAGYDLTSIRRLLGAS
ncbi:MAG: TIGR01244 family phosphatase [Alphaproteobacteria bacterium]|nr:TIGR01244 family phosphatase [Alphaproteobacteria bacterium]